jgi:adenylosuccinate synthase
VVLSGPIACGKSSLAEQLVGRFGFLLVKTHELIRTASPGVPAERASLQKAGEALDKQTKGQWVADALVRRLARESESAPVVVDSVRIKEQIAALRRAYGRSVVHVHLTAPIEDLRGRYKDRAGSIAELPSYEDVLKDPTEAQVDSLREFADVVIDTHRNGKEDVVARAASYLRLFGRGVVPLVDVLVGGQWGSEGKGNIASYLAPEYSVLVRVGGPNAGHTVYAEPAHEVFHHLPSGSRRAPKATLVLGAGSVLRVAGLIEEIARHEIEVQRLAIDPQAMLIDDADPDLEKKSRLREAIGSTLQGVGAATSRKVLRNTEPPVRLARDEPLLAPYVRSAVDILEKAYAEGSRVLLEGTQGTGLSLHHGQYPYVTSRDTTVSGCLAEAGIPPGRVRRVLMVCRSYPIRVGGNSGPMGIETTWEEVAARSGKPVEELVRIEKTTTTKRDRRVAEFGWREIQRGCVLNGPTDIALTFADYIDATNTDARRFEQLTAPTIRFVEELERVTGTPVSLISTRFDFRNVIDRRTW